MGQAYTNNCVGLDQESELSAAAAAAYYGLNNASSMRNFDSDTASSNINCNKLYYSNLFSLPNMEISSDFVNNNNNNNNNNNTSGMLPDSADTDKLDQTKYYTNLSDQFVRSTLDDYNSQINNNDEQKIYGEYKKSETIT